VPENKWEKKMNDGCGQTQLGLFENFDHLGSSLKTHLLSGCMDLSGLSLSWKISGTASSRSHRSGTLHLCKLVLGRSARPTSGIESGSWPTIRASERCDYQYDRGDHSKPRLTLQGEAKREACNWPTPDKNIGDRGGTTETGDRPSGSKRQVSLNDATKSAGLLDQESDSTNGKPQGSLNSAWVRSLLGWPDEYYNALEEAATEYHLTKPQAGRTKASCG
jgi:hypothetical protein